MSQRTNQYTSNLLQDILSEQHQLSQQQQNMLGSMYSTPNSSANIDREWTPMENQILRQALSTTNETAHNSCESYQIWLEQVSKLIGTRTPEEVAKRIFVLNKKQQQQQYTISQKSTQQQYQESGSGQISPPDSTEAKKRKRMDREPSPPQEKERSKRAKHGNRQRLLDLADLTDEDKSEQQEDIMGNILEENQEHIVAIRRNISNGNLEANEPLIKEFKANISAIIKTMQNMKGIMAHMNPIDDLIGGIDWDS